ncbi:epoxide hydrolase family protein [Kineosporia corallincola]|nr:epoxide hydrolase [Kineosporia corallincola]
MTDDALVPFTVHVPQAELDDLTERIRRTRWPEPATVAGWSQGMPLEHLRRLCERWAGGYDWRAAEARLNAWPQYRTVIDGLAIHVLHARSPHPQARPLLLTHGWPGSVLEFSKLMTPLTDPADPSDAFHVVAPSLPGYGFSDRPTDSGWGIERIAAAWATLMARLGHRRYLAAGSDWGTSITSLLAVQDAAHVCAVHLVPPLAPPGPQTDVTDWEHAALEDLKAATANGSAYSETHRTRPQTIGYALTDSPAALCAWLGEKYRLWSDHDDPGNDLSDDDVLDAVTLYWLTRTGASAARLYWESIDTVSSWFTHGGGPVVTVPVGASVFAHETPRISRRWAEPRYRDIRLWRRHEHGGHFAALEAPHTLITDLRDLARLTW